MQSQPTCLLMLSCELDLVWSNSATQALLAADEGVCERDGKLEIDDAAQGAALAAALGRAEAKVRSHVILFEPRRPNLICRYLLLDGERPLVGASLIKARLSDNLDLDALAGVYGLSPAETRVVRELLLGNSLQVAADLLGISIQTARTHVKHIYTKLGVLTREGFFATCSVYALALDDPYLRRSGGRASDS